MTRSEFDAQHQPVHVSGWVWCKGAVMCVYMLVHVSVPMPACGWVGAFVCLCSVGCRHGGDLLCSGLGQNSNFASLC